MLRNVFVEAMEHQRLPPLPDQGTVACLTCCRFNCRVFEKNGVKLVVDNVSYDFVKGSTVDYVEELISSAFVVSFEWLYCSIPELGHYFRLPNCDPTVLCLGIFSDFCLYDVQVSTNPSAVGGCSCKSSYRGK